MADANTCEQCGATNKPVRQSKRGKLFCFPCWDNENPQENKELTDNIEKAHKEFKENLKFPDKNESVSSGQTQKEERTFRYSPKRLHR